MMVVKAVVVVNGFLGEMKVEVLLLLYVQVVVVVVFASE